MLELAVQDDSDDVDTLVVFYPNGYGCDNHSNFQPMFQSTIASVGLRLSQGRALTLDERAEEVAISDDSGYTNTVYVVARVQEGEDNRGICNTKVTIHDC